VHNAVSLEHVRGEVRALGARLRSLKTEVDLCVGTDDDPFARKLSVRVWIGVYDCVS
jgi:hypothetical protein